MSSNGARGRSLDTLLEDLVGALGGLHSSPTEELLKWVQQQQAEADKRMASTVEQGKQQAQEVVRKFREDQAQIRAPLKDQMAQIGTLQLRIKDLEKRLAADNSIPLGNPSPVVQVCSQA
jgi:hypothetical protein